MVEHDKESIFLRAEGVAAPSFTLDATDALAYPFIVQYSRTCREFGLERQAQAMAKMAEEFREWQTANPEKVGLSRQEFVSQLPDPALHGYHQPG